MRAAVADAQQTDRELLAGHRSGRPAAFDALYARHKNALWLHARTILRDDALAEDAVHEAFLRLDRSGDAALAASGSLGPFLHTTLRRLCIDRRRSDTAARRRERETGAWIRPKEASVDRAQVDELEAALRRLPAEQLEAVLLHAYAGMTFQEVAEAVGAPEKTIGSRYGAALRKLAEMLGGRADE
jgi:RNA polymerase sigma-70 factor, ECF subfamily